MKFLKLISDSSEIEEKDYDVIYYNKTSKEVTFKGAKSASVFKERKDTVAGDIALSTTDGIKFISYDNYSETLGTPIGVVVIPASHIDNNTVKVMSLANMSYKTPESGDLTQVNNTTSTNLVWGQYQIDVKGLTNYNTLDGDNSHDYYFLSDLQKENVILYKDADGKLTDSIDKATYFCEYYYAPDGGKDSQGTSYEYKGGYVEYVRDDTSSSWSQESSDGFESEIAPYPYNEDGTKNTSYGTAGASSDMSGKSNTSILVAKHTADDLSTATTITNATSSTVSWSTLAPAAAACYLYHTEGTSKGDWYLPAQGEMGYIWAKINTINKSLSKIGSSKAVPIGTEATYSTLGYWSWSSSECTSSFAWVLNAFYGGANLIVKFYNIDDTRVRALSAL